MARYNGQRNDQTAYGLFPEEQDVEVENEGAQRANRGSKNCQTSPQAIYNPFYTGRPRTPANGSRSTPIDRQEIIRKIKSAGSRAASPELERPMSRSSGKKRKSPTLDQPAVEAGHARREPAEVSQSIEEIGLQIERPRSALHRGDFRERDSSIGVLGFSTPARDEPTTVLSTSPVAPWHRDFPQAALHQARQARQPPSAPPGLSIPAPPQPSRARAASSVSLASSFVYKPPTSPLVQASRPDTPEPNFDRRSRSPDKDRRRTFSPQSFQRFRSSHDGFGSPQYAHQRQRPSPRPDTTFPYQAHQPRRSINALGSVPHALFGEGRRPSLSDSPLHLAPMVGSYEESILRGRMSTTPSKPLNFVAQIGVLGKGDCKPSLKCPPHATVPFPAVFYSYGVGARSTTTGDQPSPYVGLVDLENNLPNQPPSPEKRRHRIQQATYSNEGSRASSHNREDGAASPSDTAQARQQQRRRQRRKQRRRSGSPKAPPGGSYRIPQQGQIQVVIKNPNKTAVKLFLIPYDLSDMEPGQKTFIRQRSYSAGPIIDMPLSSRKNLGTDRPEAALNTSEDPNERPMLRYLVHLHICCPAKGRYFLYKSIRVVFANRVPDGKEKLRNEIQLPEPRYSTYKAGRDPNVGSGGGGGLSGRGSNVQDHQATLTAANAGGAEILSPNTVSAAGGNTDHHHHHHSLPWSQQRRLLAQSLPSTEYNLNYAMHSIQPIPFQFPSSALPTLESRPVSRQMSDGTVDVDSEFSAAETAYAANASTAADAAALSPFASTTTSATKGMTDFSPATTAASTATGTSAGLDDARGLDEPFNFERDTNREHRTAAVAVGSGRSELSRRLKDLAFQAQNRRGSEY